MSPPIPYLTQTVGPCKSVDIEELRRGWRQKPFLCKPLLTELPLKRPSTRLVGATSRAKTKQKMLAKWPDLPVIIVEWASHYNLWIDQDLNILLSACVSIHVDRVNMYSITSQLRVYQLRAFCYRRSVSCRAVFYFLDIFYWKEEYQFWCKNGTIFSWYTNHERHHLSPVCMCGCSFPTLVVFASRVWRVIIWNCSYRCIPSRYRHTN